VSPRESFPLHWTFPNSFFVLRRSLVRPEFNLVVHIRESNLLEVPAPFLNRFEKYRLSLSDVLTGSWSKFGRIKNIVEAAAQRVATISSLFESGSFNWVSKKETIESIFVDLLPKRDSVAWLESVMDHENVQLTAIGFRPQLTQYIEQVTSISDAKPFVDDVIDLALECLTAELGSRLRTALDQPDDVYTPTSPLCSSEDTDLSQIIDILVQMAITQYASFRMLQVTPPELLFKARYVVSSGFFPWYSFSLCKIPFATCFGEEVF
jgi:hypothetical protein